jgi:hypothetical protein
LFVFAKKGAHPWLNDGLHLAPHGRSVFGKQSTIKIAIMVNDELSLFGSQAVLSGKHFCVVLVPQSDPIARLDKVEDRDLPSLVILTKFVEGGWQSSNVCLRPVSSEVAGLDRIDGCHGSDETSEQNQPIEPFTQRANGMHLQRHSLLQRSMPHWEGSVASDDLNQRPTLHGSRRTVGIAGRAASRSRAYHVFHLQELQ